MTSTCLPILERFKGELDIRVTLFLGGLYSGAYIRKGIFVSDFGGLIFGELYSEGNMC